MIDLVKVRRQPHDWRTPIYRVEDFDGIHWDCVTGGMQLELPHLASCAYVLCNEMIEGEPAHSCLHGPPPHTIKVVIPKSINDPRLWAKLAGEEYKEPKALDMAPDAVAKRRDRAPRRAAATRASNRLARIEELSRTIGMK